MINIMAVTSMLNGLGFECDSCTDGEQAVEAVKDRYMDEKATMYDLIFMDFSMPYCDGCEATKQIYQFASKHQLAVPYICCLTAYPDNDYKIAAKEAGMKHLFVKPIMAAQVRKILIKTGLMLSGKKKYKGKEIEKEQETNNDDGFN